MTMVNGALLTLDRTIVFDSRLLLAVLYTDSIELSVVSVIELELL